MGLAEFVKLLPFKIGEYLFKIVHTLGVSCP